MLVLISQDKIQTKYPRYL